MKSIRAEPTSPTELSWLSEVTESRQPLSELSPVWVRHGVIDSGPPVPHPERHPYCEFGTTLDGMIVSFVGREQTERRPRRFLFGGTGGASLGHDYQVSVEVHHGLFPAERLDPIGAGGRRLENSPAFYRQSIFGRTPGAAAAQGVRAAVAPV